MFVITRSFVRKGETISNVTLELNAKGEITLDGKLLPDNSVEHLLNFALQSLQDSYAGSADTKEARENFAKKYEKLISGTIGVRNSSGESVSDEVRIGRKIMRELIRKQNPEAWKKLKEMSDEEQNAALDKNIAKNAAKLSPMIAEEMKRIQAEKKAKALLGKELSFEL